MTDQSNRSPWQDSEARLMEFERAWREDSPPELSKFVQAKDDLDDEQLLELAKVDLEHRLKRKLSVRAEDYWREFPPLSADYATRLELLLFEVSIRRSGGSLPTRQQWLERFPDDPSLVDRLNEECQPPSPSNGEADAAVSVDSVIVPGMMLHQYQVEQRVGSGAFSVVFSGRDTRLNRPVAIKVLRDHQAEDPSIRLRMLREAQAVAVLQHPNVVPVYGTGQFRGLDYVVHRLIDGPTLEAALAERKLNIRQSVEIGRALADALALAHSRGIVHRDIKPANIMLEGTTPLLVDFGLAHVRDASLQLTMEGDVVGTPAYMAPEQAEGKSWQGDPRSDIYSLGAVLFRLVCQRLPFEGTTAQVIRQVLSREPPLPRKLNSSVDIDLQTIILKCLEKDVRSRYGSATELEQDLGRYLAGQTIMARPAGWLGSVVKWSRRRPAVAGLALGVICLLAFSSGVLSQLWQVRRERDRAQQAEQQTEVLLAQASADAGRLAMSRGDYAVAIEHFRASLQRGAADPHRLRLQLVEAYVALRDIPQAEEQLTTVLASGSPWADCPASWLWQAELNLEGRAQFGDALERFQMAVDAATESSEIGQLSAADRNYALGMLAERSQESVLNFKQAVELAPYHHRSRRMLVIMLVSLARFDEAMTQLNTARQLFPKDQEFLLMESLVRSALDQSDQAHELIEDSGLYVSERQQWRDFCKLVRHVVHAFPIDDGLSELSTAKLDELSRDFERHYGPLIGRHGWRFPPKIASAFQTLPKQIAALNSQSAQLGTEALEQLIDIHPDASLMNLLADIYLAGVGLPETPQEASIERLERAQELYLLATESRGFLNDSQSFAWKGLFTTAISLAFSFHHEREANQNTYSRAAQYIDPDSVRPRHLRVFTITLVNAGRWTQARKWGQAWAGAAADEAEQCDALWHIAITHQQEQHWLEVLRLGRDILELNPDHKRAPGLVRSAISEIQQRTEDQ